MQPTSSDNQAAEPVDTSAPADSAASPGSDAYTTDSTSPAPMSSAMSDALAATAAANAVGKDDQHESLFANDALATDNLATGPVASEPKADDTSPIFGPTPASEALANDPLSSSNNSSAPAVSQPTSEQAINSSVDAIVTDTPAAPIVSSSDDPVDEPAIQAAPVVNDLPAVSASSATENSDDLLSLKQQALQQLSPLVGHLDQSPEEKFRTTMMMLQATDNPALVKEAYEFAQQITDEKVRAQALLDVVNEINYFTHQQNQPSQPAVFND